MTTTHKLKTDPRTFEGTWSGDKTFDIRFNDRDFRVGDVLHLVETKHSGEEMAAGAALEYTGREVKKTVTHMLMGYGLAEGWICMSHADRGSINENDLVEIARMHAARQGKDDENAAPYIKRVLNNPLEWEPHDWVIAMAREVYANGMLAGTRIGRQDMEYVLAQSDAQHDRERTEMIRACAAAILEAVSEDNDQPGGRLDNGHINWTSVRVNVEAQRTIWDRYELTTDHNEEKTEITFILRRKSPQVE